MHRYDKALTGLIRRQPKRRGLLPRFRLLGELPPKGRGKQTLLASPRLFRSPRFSLEFFCVCIAFRCRPRALHALDRRVVRPDGHGQQSASSCSESSTQKVVLRSRSANYVKALRKQAEKPNCQVRTLGSGMDHHDMIRSLIGRTAHLAPQER